MKNLILILLTLTTLGTSLPLDDNTYSGELPEITVKASFLENYIPQRASTWCQKEFINLNRPLIQYLAYYTWLSEAQVYAMLRMEQGKGSYLLTEHNNPFNIKGNGILATTWENTPDNIVNDHFASYRTLKEGLSATIVLINNRYYHEPTDDEVAIKHLYDKGWHTDPNLSGRVKLAKYYKNYYGDAVGYSAIP